MSFQDKISLLKCSNKKVLVIGLGISGIESARFLRRHELSVRLIERQSEELFLSKSKFSYAVQELRALGVEISFGLDGERIAPLLADVGLVILSPGVPIESAVVGTINRLGVPYVSELELGIELHGGRSLVVTGSNGKSTTVSLLDFILRQAGLRSYLCGNVGTPVISNEELHQESVGQRSLLVVEASSYQLEACTVLKPAVSIILNLSENHLERHGSLERYGAAKGRVMRLQTSEDLAIVNADDPAVMSLANSCSATLALFGRAALTELTKRAPICASIDESNPDGAIIRVSIEGKTELYETRSSALLGAHNRYNMAAAILAARRIGVVPEVIQSSLDTFTPLEHRLEVVLRRDIDTALVINDSKSTTVAASIAALSTVRRHFPQHRLIIMIGGLSKAGSWEPLLALIKAEGSFIEPVICFGKDGPLLASHCRAQHIPCVVAATLRSGADLALESLDQLGQGVVLLTPGCASFDEFTDFEHRGTEFKRYVHEAIKLPISV